MAETDVVRFSLRLNLKKEQHSKIYKVLSALDKNVHKSENQFILNAVDFYIQSFEEDGIMDLLHQKDKPGYVTAADLREMRREIENSLKEELIRLLGTAMLGNPVVWGKISRTEPVQEETKEINSFAAEVANRWG